MKEITYTHSHRIHFIDTTNSRLPRKINANAKMLR